MTFIESIYQRWEIPRHSLQQQVPSDEDTSTTTNSFSYDEGIVIGSPCLRQDRNTMMLSTSFNEEPFFSTHFSSQVKTNHGEEDNHDNHFEEQDDDDDDSRYPEHTQHAGDSSDTDDEETYDGQTFCWADYTVSFSAQSPTSNKQRWTGQTEEQTTIIAHHSHAIQLLQFPTWLKLSSAVTQSTVTRLFESTRKKKKKNGFFRFALTHMCDKKPNSTTPVRTRPVKRKRIIDSDRNDDDNDNADCKQSTDAAPIPAQPPAKRVKEAQELKNRVMLMDDDDDDDVDGEEEEDSKKKNTTKSKNEVDNKNLANFKKSTDSKEAYNEEEETSEEEEDEEDDDYMVEEEKVTSSGRGAKTQKQPANKKKPQNSKTTTIPQVTKKEEEEEEEDEEEEETGGAQQDTANGSQKQKVKMEKKVKQEKKVEMEKKVKKEEKTKDKNETKEEKKKTKDKKKKKDDKVKEEEKSDDDESQNKRKKETTPTKTKKEATPTKKKKVKIAEDDNNDGNSAKKKSSQKSKTKAEKEEKKEEQEVYKWWEEEKISKAKRSERKWKTLKHNGVIFAPEYVPHGVKVLYKKKPVELTVEQEEVATFFATVKGTEWETKEKFRKNFWEGWSKILGKEHTIQDLENCDFTAIWEHLMREKDKQLTKTKEEKKKEKEEKDKIEEPYKYCEIDNRKEKVANYKIEPPGLFRGRGDHPKMGSIKKRIQPEDIIVNIGKKEDTPKPPKGHKWGDIIHKNTGLWLVSWKDTVTGDFKYVGLGASSSFKGRSDYAKYETARTLKKSINKIRKNYKKEWESEDPLTRQRAVALYFIDKLALRVGNEKDEDEADTVGCCSLRVEHIELQKPNIVKFDFLGKDSIRYQNSVEVEEKVFSVLTELVKAKSKDAELFDQLSPTSLNNHLKKLCDGLSAKVFRTFNASLTLDKELRRDEESLKGQTVTEKLAYFNTANRQVAILCNHQRAAPKTQQQTEQTYDIKIAMLKEYKKDLEDAKKSLKKESFDDVKKKWDEHNQEIQSEFDEKMEEYTKKKTEIEENGTKQGKPLSIVKKEIKELVSPKKPIQRVLPKNEKLQEQIEKTTKKIKDLEVEKTMKRENSTVALGTSRINYCDPRITVAFCKRNEVPVSKIFSKTLQQKFPWAMDAEEDYEF